MSRCCSHSPEFHVLDQGCLGEGCSCLIPHAEYFAAHIIHYEGQCGPCNRPLEDCRGHSRRARRDIFA